MRKVILTLSLLTSLLVSNMAMANDFFPETNKIKSHVETVLVHQSSKNGPQYATIDHNPTGYNKQVIGGKTFETWIKDGVAYAAVEGVTTKAHRINKDIETVLVHQSSKNGPQYITIDHNPTGYNKQVIGGKTFETWIKDDVAYTESGGVTTKTHPINKASEDIPRHHRSTK